MKLNGNLILSVLSVILISIIIASLFGIIHDQITYSISEEYYTKFKFNQFRIAGTIYNRIGVIIVGIGSTWWVGLILGIIISIISYIYSKYNFIKSSIKSIFIIIGVIIIIEIIGFLTGCFIFDLNSRNWIIPEDVVNKRNFLTVGTIHTVGYLGAIIGILSTIVIQKREKKIDQKNKNHGP